MNWGKFEEDKTKKLAERVDYTKLTDHDKILFDIAESLAVIAGKVGRKLL